MALEMFESFLEDTIEDRCFDLDTVGSLVALALLEAGTDRESALLAIQKAQAVFRDNVAVQDAEAVFSSVAYHLSAWIEDGI